MDSSRNGKQKQGWFKLDNEAVDDWLARLGPHAFAVFAVLARHANNKPGSQCYGSIAYLCRTTGMSRSTVLRALKALSEAGVISRRRETDARGGNTPNSYALLMGGGSVSQTPSPLVSDRDYPSVSQTPPSVSQTPKKERLEKERLPRTDASASIGTHGYPDDFEEAWSKYPKRAGGNPKRSAYKAWQARVKAGRSARELIAGTERYAAFVRATGKERTEYVKQARTFFGPDEPFLETWEVPATGGRRVLPGERYDPDAKDVCDDW